VYKVPLTRLRCGRKGGSALWQVCHTKGTRAKGTIAHLEQSNKTEEAMIVVRVLVVNQAVTITVIWIRDDENYNDAGAAAVAAGNNDEGGDDDDDDDTNEPALAVLIPDALEMRD